MGFSLEWIEELWPIALGVYLIVKAVQDRTSGTPAADITVDPSPYGSDTDSSPLV